MAIVKDLGTASAYGYAKDGGYTGTEEEFATLMASYADVAETAIEARDDAIAAKNDAVTAKNDAQASATSAANNASTATTKATEASASATAASQSATNADSFATAASGSASTASAKATEASASATTASGKATEAANSATAAQTAQTGAEAAQAAAEAAAESVEESAEQIAQNKADIEELVKSKAPIIVDTATGAIASFADGSNGLPLKSLVASIEPVQDLHGYDSPWPAGGGKNKQQMIAPSGGRGISFSLNVDGSLHVSGTATSDATFYINGSSYAGNDTPELSAGTYTMFCNKFPTNGSSNTRVTFNGKYSNGNNPASSTLLARADGTKNTLIFTATDVFKSALYLFIASGETVDFDLEIQLESGSSATAYAPYSNECPISGWTGMNGQRTGKNLLPKAESKTHNGVQFVANSDGSVTVSGTSTGIAILDIGRNLTVLKAGEYVASISGSNAVVTIFKIVNDVVSVVRNGIGAFTLAEDTSVFMRLSFASGALASGTAYPQIELGSTASAYSQYQAETLSVNWQDTAGTVYGGTMTVNEDGSGKLVANIIRRKITSSDSFSALTGTGFYQFTYYLDSSLYKRGSSLNALCNIFPKIALGDRGNTSGLVGYSDDSGYRFALKEDMGITTTAEFKSWLDSNDLYVTAELIEPITYRFDNLTQLKTVLGTNNIFVDCGQATAEYRADTKLYIDKKLAALVAALS